MNQIKKRTADQRLKRAIRKEQKRTGRRAANQWFDPSNSVIWPQYPGRIEKITSRCWIGLLWCRSSSWPWLGAALWFGEIALVALGVVRRIAFWGEDSRGAPVIYWFCLGWVGVARSHVNNVNHLIIAGVRETFSGGSLIELHSAYTSTQATSASHWINIL